MWSKYTTKRSESLNYLNSLFIGSNLKYQSVCKLFQNSGFPEVAPSNKETTDTLGPQVNFLEISTLSWKWSSSKMWALAFIYYSLPFVDTSNTISCIH